MYGSSVLVSRRIKNSPSPNGAWKVAFFGWKLVYFYLNSSGDLIKSENEFLEEQDPEIIYTMDPRGLNDKIWAEGFDELNNSLNLERAYHKLSFLIFDFPIL